MTETLLHRILSCPVVCRHEVNRIFWPNTCRCSPINALSSRDVKNLYSSSIVGSNMLFSLPTGCLEVRNTSWKEGIFQGANGKWVYWLTQQALCVCLWIVSTSQGIKCVWGEFKKQSQMSSVRSSFMPPVQYNGPTRNPHPAETSIRIMSHCPHL